MRRWAAAIGLVLSWCWTAPGCTQDFDQFVVGDGPSTSAAGGTQAVVGGAGGTGQAGGSGGEVGAGAGGARNCGVRPDPPGGQCPDVCDRCEDDQCIIECNTLNACRFENITCPEGFACSVSCGGNSACSNATIACPSIYGCDLTCAGINACVGLTFACSTGSCSITCAAVNACLTTQMTCGTGECAAACRPTLAAPNVACNDACACTPCTES